MYIIRDTFYLKFGHFKNANGLLDEFYKKGLAPVEIKYRILSDFTGEAYRLIFEQSVDSLATYEESLKSVMAQAEWQTWYASFKEHIERSYREILKEIM
jgi:hypothetical protein